MLCHLSISNHSDKGEDPSAAFFFLEIIEKVDTPRSPTILSIRVSSLRLCVTTDQSSKLIALEPAKSVFCSKLMIVIGPVPPGTGVM